MNNEEMLQVIGKMFETMEGRFDNLENDMKELKSEMQEVKERLENVENKLDNIESRLENVEFEVHTTNLFIENEITPRVQILLEAQSETHRRSRNIPRKAEKLEEDAELLAFAHGDILKKVGK